jgi:hypothetical protein
MRFLLLLTFIFCALNQSAQKYYNDAQLRTTLSLTYKPTKKFAIHLDDQNRWNKNVSDYYRTALTAGLSYRITKMIRLRGDYTYIIRESQEGYYSQRNWYSLALVARHDIDKFKFVYRNLFQARGRPANSDEAGLFRLYDRNKLTIRYETTKRLTLYTGGEIYIPLNSPQTKGIDRTRYIGGLEIRTFKNQDIDLYFMFQDFIQRNNWWDQTNNNNRPQRRDWIYVIGYNIEF